MNKRKWDREKRILRLIINAVIVILVFGAWFQMFFQFEDGVLSSWGLRSLKYFTVLSNLMEGIACIVWLLAVWQNKRSTNQKSAAISRDGKGTDRISLVFAERLKYVGCVAVSLTFLTVMLFLGPVFGWTGIFAGANLWFHLVVPVIAILEFVFLEAKPIRKKDNRLAVLPTLAYATAYLCNVLIRGTEGNDWYGFVTWGLPIGLIFFLISCIVTYLIGLLLRLAGQ